ncbi:MAG: hypothetical protein LBS07_00010 [Prevotellaceae bacterium]|jgi:hypothetical protein|nr:hypothetical protein [Prevotellaceae bacterium]
MAFINISIRCLLWRAGENFPVTVETLRATSLHDAPQFTADISVSILDDSLYRQAKSFTVKNTGKNPSLMTFFDIKQPKCTFFTNENYFWLLTGEEKNSVMSIKLREELSTREIKCVIDSRNATKQIKKVTL